MLCLNQGGQCYEIYLKKPIYDILHIQLAGDFSSYWNNTKQFEPGFTLVNAETIETKERTVLLSLPLIIKGTSTKRQ
jgi:hypothetical protein